MMADEIKQNVEQPVEASVTKAGYKLDDIYAETNEYQTDKLWVIMGPQHPFSHGLWTLKVELDGEYVTDAEPIVGYLHRGWEKETENRTYAKIIPMTDRLCYAASQTYSHLYCMTVEKALGIEIPQKAKYLRVVADEICRVDSSASMLRISSMFVMLSRRFCFLSPLKRLYSPAVMPAHSR